jgi:hypothetical protein
MTDPGRCSSCGLPLDPPGPGGLCPTCLLKLEQAVTLASSSPGSSASDAPTMTSAGPGTPPAVRGQLTPGQIFGPYRVHKLLGRGGMGEVYAADHLEHGRRLALKVLTHRLSPDNRARFLREGQIAASLNHPHSVYIFGSEEIDGTPVITMELVPGGTLKDKVAAGGPLAPAAAVDAILDVISGLDAAHAAGILHRDIKPSNCFVDHDGSVKVGDFGLSISTLAREVNTRTGVFEGTPQFAAPEQLRGEPLDVRADIYAVGATLYYLLIGQPPFDDADLTTLVTRVRDEPARSPRAISPTVAKDLAAVVVQCLEKDKTARPSTYAALVDALGPFSSTARRPATLRSRFAAAVIDYLLILLGLNAVFSLTSLISGGRSADSAWWKPVELLAIAFYFTITEGLAGASAGKRLVALRVRGTDGDTPGLVRAFVRSMLYAVAACALLWIPAGFWTRPFVPAGPLDYQAMSRAAGVVGIISTVRSVLTAFFPFVLFLPARSRNGLAGLHELISGTRVTTADRAPLASRHVVANVEKADWERDGAPGLPTRGPFVLGRMLVPAAALFLGFDRVLKREVWIRDLPAGTPVSDAARRDLSRRGRLRWLAGQTASGRTWEVFEAPGGASLLSCIATPQPWRVVRSWLSDLAEELAHGVDEGQVPPLGLDRVWITSYDRAKLLDFPAPGTERDAAAGMLDDTDCDGHGFLSRVACSALAGRVVASSEPLPITRPPLPRSGVELLRALRDARSAPLHDVLELSARAMQSQTEVSHWSRAFFPAVVLGLCSILAIGIVRVMAQLPGEPGANRVASEESVLLNSLVRIERMRRAGVPAADPERQALEIYVTRRFAPLTRRPELDEALRPFRSLADDIARRHPSVSDADLLAALQHLGRNELDRLNRPSLMTEAPAFVLLRALTVFAYCAYVVVLLAFVFRGGLVLGLFRVALVDARGIPVPRWRALLRAGCAWSPVILFQLLPQQTLVAFATYPALAWMMVGTAGAVMAAGTCWSIASPARGLQDYIAGTWLVPR